jgi:hypothetical protein
MLPQQAHAFYEKCGVGRIKDVSTLLTMQKESELASGSINDRA